VGITLVEFFLYWVRWAITLLIFTEVIWLKTEGMHRKLAVMVSK
jgi:hypothetical protein